MERKDDMKYIALDLDLKRRTVRIGACVAWSAAIIVLGWAGHALLSAPISMADLWRLLRSLL